MTPLARAHTGTASIELVIAFVPFFLLFLGGLQICALAGAHIIVKHAAMRAARVAVVTIDDDPVFYEDGARKHLGEDGASRGEGELDAVVSTLAPGKSSSSSNGESSRGDGRMRRIRDAAYLPLSVIGPSHEQVVEWFSGASRAADAVSTELAQSGFMRVLSGLAIYGRVGAAITFPVERGSQRLRSLRDPFSDRDEITVRVTYLYPCSIPLARLIACRRLVELKAAPPKAEGQRTPWWKRLTRRDADEPEREPGVSELEHAEWASRQLPLAAHLDERFVILRAEATLPNHGAPYRYASELCKTKQKIRGCAGGGR